MEAELSAMEALVSAMELGVPATVAPPPWPPPLKPTV
jgi:hypothetical protein